jgi:hypothetical protein
MAYISDRVRAIIGEQLKSNLEAAQHGTVEDWAAYRHLCGWIAGCEYCLEAIAEAEHQLGLD